MLLVGNGELVVGCILGGVRKMGGLFFTQQMLKRGITDTIQETCSCNFTLSNLEEFETTCSADSYTLTLNTTIVYASESGNMTASTLIRMFQDRAASTSVMISFSSHTAAVRTVCSPSCTNNQAQLPH